MLLMVRGPEHEFFEHCHFGEAEEAQRMLEDPTLQRVLDVNAANPNYLGYTAMHSACENTHLGVLTLLLADSRVNPNVKTMKKGWTPLFLACWVGWVEGVALLLQDPRVDVNTRAANGLSPFTVALASDNHQVVKLIIASGRRLQLPPEMETLAPEGSESRRLVQQFLQDGAMLRWQLQCELRLEDWLAPVLFAITVLVSDGFFEVHGDHHDRLSRFFKMTSRLPLEIQMSLCYRLFRSPKDNISSEKFEAALKFLVGSGFV